jgi:hypothetical protein
MKIPSESLLLVFPPNKTAFTKKMIHLLSLAFLALFAVTSANRVSPSGVRARELLARAQSILRKGSNKALLSEGEADASSGLGTWEIVGIVAGGVALGLVIFVSYKYATWVPKTRPAKARATESSPSSPSSADDRQRLTVKQ